MFGKGEGVIISLRILEEKKHVFRLILNIRSSWNMHYMYRRHPGCRIIHIVHVYEKKNADLAIFLVNQIFSCMHYFSVFLNSRMIFIKCIYEIPRQTLKNTYSIIFFLTKCHRVTVLDSIFTEGANRLRK